MNSMHNMEQCLTGYHIRLKLGLLMTKGQLEVDVVCAQGIRAEDSPPGM